MVSGTNVFPAFHLALFLSFVFKALWADKGNSCGSFDIGNLVVGLWDSREVLHGVDWLESSWRGRGRPFRSLVIKSHLNMYILANWCHIVSILSLQLYLRTFRLGNERGSEEDQKSDLAMKVLQKLPFLAETNWGKGRMPKNRHQINQLLRKWQITSPTCWVLDSYLGQIMIPAAVLPASKPSINKSGDLVNGHIINRHIIMHALDYIQWLLW